MLSRSKVPAVSMYDSMDPFIKAKTYFKHTPTDLKISYIKRIGRVGDLCMVFSQIQL